VLSGPVGNHQNMLALFNFFLTILPQKSKIILAELIWQIEASQRPRSASQNVAITPF
jgi:hypothetical protein